MLRGYWLNRLALACSVIGVLFLVYYSLSVQPEELTIREIGRERIGSRIAVQGTIEWLHESGSTTLFTLFDGNSLGIVAFDAKLGEKRALNQSALVRVTGVVQEYHGKLEVIAEKIEPVSGALSIGLPRHAND